MVNKLFNVEIMSQVDRYDAYCEKKTLIQDTGLIILYCVRLPRFFVFKCEGPETVT